ncbi:hypothetical protein GGR52DRAFT_45470 [Hypoxylon sp. FL1284]|nr:hypothetical protein GGR52DRAFT_45470 [Hypoxylon sp. FL1284]
MDLESTPAMDAPPGEVSNLVDPYTRYPDRIAVSTTGLGIAVVFVSIRIYRRVVMKKFNHEDWVLLFSIASFAVFAASGILSSKYGDGRHLWNVSVASLQNQLYYGNILQIFICATMFPIKYVLLYQIKSIFLQHDPRSLVSRVVSILIWINLLLYSSVALALIFACTPREKIWHPDVEGYCINHVACVLIGNVLNIASDLSILIIPILGIARLQICLKKKLLAGSAFAVGIFATVASIIRLCYSVRLLYDEDFTWELMAVGNWTVVEFTMGFIVAGAPYLPGFVEEISCRCRRLATNAEAHKMSSDGVERLGSSDLSDIDFRK